MHWFDYTACSVHQEENSNTENTEKQRAEPESDLVFTPSCVRQRIDNTTIAYDLGTHPAKINMPHLKTTGGRKGSSILPILGLVLIRVVAGGGKEKKKRRGQCDACRYRDEGI